MHLRADHPGGHALVAVSPGRERGRGASRTPGPGGLAPTTAARRQHPQDIAGFQLDRALVGQALRPALVAPRQQPVLPHRTRLATGQAPRLRDPPLGDERHGGVGQHLEVALDPLAAWRRPGAAAPPPQAVDAAPASGRPARAPRWACSWCWSSRCGRRSCRRDRGGRPARRRSSRSRPTASRRPPISTLFIVPCDAAPTPSGSTWASAPRQTSATRWLTSTLPAPTAAGGRRVHDRARRARSRAPAGATPPLAGMVGSSAAQREHDRADRHRLDGVHVAAALRVGAGEVERDRSRRRW